MFSSRAEAAPCGQAGKLRRLLSFMRWSFVCTETHKAERCNTRLHVHTHEHLYSKRSHSPSLPGSIWGLSASVCDTHSATPVEIIKCFSHMRLKDTEKSFRRAMNTLQVRRRVCLLVSCLAGQCLSSKDSGLNQTHLSDIIAVQTLRAAQ